MTKRKTNNPVEMRFTAFGMGTGYRFEPYFTFRSRNVLGTRVMAYGDGNTFPNEGLSAVVQSPTAVSALERTVEFCIGDVSYGGPEFTDNLRYMLSGIVRDFALFRSYALRLVRNLDGVHVTVGYQPWSTLRLTPDRGEAVICLDWGHPLDSVRMPLYKGDLPLGEEVMFVYQDLLPQEYFYSYYPTSLFRLAQAESSVIEYYAANLSSGFQPQVMLSLPYQPSNWDEFVAKLKASYCGTGNADKLMIVAGDGEQSPAFSSIPVPDLDKYDNVYDKVKGDIITWFGVPKALLGRADASGFADQAEQLLAECAVFERTRVSGLRNNVLGSFNALMAGFGYPEVRCEPLDIRSWFEGVSGGANVAARDVKEG